MKKLQRILAILAIVILIVCAILTLVLALLDNFNVGNFTGAWRASAWCMVVIPCFIYVMLLVSRLLSNHSKKSEDDDKKVPRA